MSDVIWGGSDSAASIEAVASLGAVACKWDKADCDPVPVRDLRRAVVTPRERD